MLAWPLIMKQLHTMPATAIRWQRAPFDDHGCSSWYYYESGAKRNAHLCMSSSLELALHKERMEKWYSNAARTSCSLHSHEISWSFQLSLHSLIAGLATSRTQQRHFTHNNYINTYYCSTVHAQGLNLTICDAGMKDPTNSWLGVCSAWTNGQQRRQLPLFCWTNYNLLCHS